jgi:hypothetical protein
VGSSRKDGSEFFVVATNMAHFGFFGVFSNKMEFSNQDAEKIVICIAEISKSKQNENTSNSEKLVKSRPSKLKCKQPKKSCRCKEALTS